MHSCCLLFLCVFSNCVSSNSLVAAVVVSELCMAFHQQFHCVSVSGQF